MKKVLILLLSLTVSLGALASGDWFSQSFKEDGQNHYYVGVSEGKKNLNEALELAYQNAIDEALRHNFGFKKQGQKTFQADLYRSGVDERSFIKTQTVMLKDVRPGLQNVKKTSEGTYLVYRQVIYPKEAIAREKMRLKTLKNKNQESPNEYGLQGKTLGEVLIKTTPSNAQIMLTRVDGKGSINGTGDARFRLPLGEYHVTLLKDGYYPYHDKVLVSGKGSVVHYPLKESLGYLKVNITPIDAKIYIDNQKADNNETFPLKVGREYNVRIEHGDYQTHVETVSPWVDQTVHLTQSLIPKKARLSVITQPSGARVIINGEVVGLTPLQNFPYDPSRVEVRVSKVGFEEERELVLLRPNSDHAPIVFMLKKERPRRPTSIEEDTVDTEVEEVSSDGLSIFSNNLSRHNWIYNPVVGDQEKTTFLLLPVQYQYFMYRHLALGFDYRYHLETDDVEFTQNGRIEEYDKETVSQVWSVNSTLYLIRNRKFSIGFGPEYTWRKKQVNYLEPGSESRVASFSAQEEALGYKAVMQLGISERANGHVFGLNFDYRKYDTKNPELGSWSLGFYWEF